MVRQKLYHTKKEQREAHRIAAKKSYNKCESSCPHWRCLGFHFERGTHHFPAFRHRPAILEKIRDRREQQREE
jgi:hypothetical protein